MHELKLVRGTQITAYADDAPLFGLLSLNAVQQILCHDIYEYLSSIPCERLSQGERYEITLRFLSLFDDQLPADRTFTLRVEDDEYAYSYKNCRLTLCKSEIDGNDHAVKVVTVQADTMEKRRATDE